MRKKPERTCFNPENYSLFYVKETCRCTDDDYHCDFGYLRNENGLCVLSKDVNIYSFMSDPPHCNEFYWRSDGYKKNAESFCENGV